MSPPIRSGSSPWGGEMPRPPWHSASNPSVPPTGSSSAAWVSARGPRISMTRLRIIATMKPDYEAIAAHEPDLILDTNSSGEQERYDRLSEIAPTVGVPEGGDNYLTTMDQQVDLVAEALGKEDEGKSLLDDLDQTFEDAAKDHPEFDGKSVTVAAKTSEGWGAYV